MTWRWLFAPWPLWFKKAAWTVVCFSIPTKILSIISNNLSNRSKFHFIALKRARIQKILIFIRVLTCDWLCGCIDPWWFQVKVGLCQSECQRIGSRITDGHTASYSDSEILPVVRLILKMPLLNTATLPHCHWSCILCWCWRARILFIFSNRPAWAKAETQITSNLKFTLFYSLASPQGTDRVLLCCHTKWSWVPNSRNTGHATAPL